MVVSKFQIPKPDILFSKNALITTRNGSAVMLIRVGNRRVNLLYETRVALALLKPKSTIEGETYVEYLPLNVEFPPTVTAVATIVHKIDRRSPLRRVLKGDPDELRKLAISVSFIGHDSVYNDMLSCTTQYKGSDLSIGGILFGDMFERVDKGKGIRANFKKFDDIKEAVDTSDTTLLLALGIGDDSSSEEDELMNQDFGVPIIATKRRQYGAALSNSFRQIKNDVTGQKVLLKLPEPPEKDVVYLCYGGILLKNKMIRLCPYSRILYLALLETKINFQIIEIDWENKPNWYLQKVPSGNTPAILLNGKWTYNSRDLLRMLSKKFPNDMAQLNRYHPLPASPFELYDTLEKYAYPAILSSPTKFKAMQDMTEKDSLILCNTTWGDDLKRLVRDQIWINMPKLDKSDEYLYLCVGCYLRGDRLVRNCPYSQSIEMLLRYFDLPYKAVLVDLEHKPKWFQGPAPKLIYVDKTTGGEQKTIEGSQEITRYIFMDLIHKKSEHAHIDMDGQCPHSYLDELEGLIHDYMLDHEGYEKQLRAKLSMVENMLCDHQENELGWEPYYSSGQKMGIIDLVFGPHLYHYFHFRLQEMCGFNIEKEGYPKLAKYITLISNTSLFRETTVVEEAKTFVMYKETEQLLQTYKPEQLPERLRDLETLKKNEEHSVRKIFQQHGASTTVVRNDGSLIHESGTIGPNLESNTFYLAVGCIKRGDQLAKCCPYSRVIEMIIKEAGIPHHIIRVNLGNKPAWFTKNSSGSCPNMYWNGKWISESQVIVDNLKILFPEKMDRVLAYLPDFHVHEMGLFNYADPIQEAYLKAKRNDPEREAKRQNLLKLLSTIENQLEQSHGPFLGGAHLSVDDCALITSVWRVTYVCIAYYHKFDLAQLGFPKTKQWIKLMKKRPSFTESIPLIPEPFLNLFMAKYHGDANDPENNLLKITEVEKQKEKEAIVKVEGILRLHEETTDEDEMCHLNKIRLILDALNNIFKAIETPYLCGKKVGMADIIIFSTLMQVTDFMIGMQNYHINQEGYQAIQNYLDKVIKRPGFDQVFSPARNQLFKLHMANRVAEKYPHLALTRLQKENVELEALTNINRNKYKRSRTSTTLSSRSSSVSRSSSSVTSDDTSNAEKNDEQTSQDLLFCI